MIDRRRFLTVAAASIATAKLARAGTAEPVEWRGRAMGAEARILLHHEDRAAALRLIDACQAEIERLEAIFSLYRSDSALCRLNREGRLDAPPMDLVLLLQQARNLGDLTGGAFDVTVQPLWTLYADHFSMPAADPTGPPEQAVSAARDLVDYRQIRIAPERLSLGRSGMAITLNGIAQGYVTDRIADLLRKAGMADLLVNMGETRARGPRRWQVGLSDPFAPERIAETLSLVDLAIATSGGYGMRFSPSCHHLFDALTGRCAQGIAAATVIAPNATTADALSTALVAAGPDRAVKLARRFGAARTLLTFADGRTLAQG